MFVAKDSNEVLIHASHGIKSHSYFCPYCHHKVKLKQGSQKAWHFAHESLKLCNPIETIAHQDSKLILGDMCHKANLSYQIEPYLKPINRYPDLLIESHTVLEVQYSKVPISTIQERTRDYHKLGLNVIWLIKLCNKKGPIINLSTFESAFINPKSLKLYAFSLESREIIAYEHLQHIGGRKFIGHRQAVPLKHILKSEETPHSDTYKLSSNEILNLIKTCRRKNDVREENLSLMYQARLSDKAVVKHCGYIFPEQIYIRTHPVTWQLFVYKLHQEDRFDMYAFIKFLRFRDFYMKRPKKGEIASKLAQAYLNMLKQTLKRANSLIK
ncbi:competence protein CoiA [Staphylococcus massiliensis]|uniref:Competence protein CoiA-like family protein n=1 Tax=Staphylococcus massiliensis S46 TaxID=1229783 RepID=K9AL49_9STAP|nr:competence protein CoiA family protein [Staphylococcus massiliensis]EKU48093.1 competence protein CoiA-like family protein [Staphylococcus massiliensis S46]MCG3399861.1 competence protein CoiA-like family protein [Staphylococcus massiliensis]MCG3401598.1 competence protein CoiA-like family protein [Staphylococcus massiliensis]MCG3412132.1 competence protein CoiA-like family protein [Staphylococcus massiliensis]PNZ97513.1 competence protein CoiA-like family protein [Staphylococcus massiliens